MRFGLQRWIAEFCQARAGSVSVVTALALPALVGMTGFALEYGGALATKAENQRIADLGAYAGAVAYNASGSTATMRSVVSNLASLNGLQPASVTAALVKSPTGSGSDAVQVTVNTTSTFALTQVLGGAATTQVAATAYAELRASAKGCIVALSPTGSGVTLSGGTTVQAPGCAVSSNTSVTVPCGTKIVTTTVNYGTTPPSVGCGGITAPSGATTKILKAVTADPLAGNGGVTTGAARLSSVKALTSPGAPSVPTGADLVFDSSSVSSTQTALTAQGCSSTFNSSTWTVTCPGNATFKFGKLTTGGGITLNFNIGGSSGATYNFTSISNNGGSVLSFGPGTYNVLQGISNVDKKVGKSMTFSGGTFRVGASSVACNGSSGYSICNPSGATLQVMGPSTFVLQGGIYNGGGATLKLGSGLTNSFKIGKASDGNSFVGDGGSITAFADATSGSSVFQMAGSLNITSGGGSCLTVSAAAQHDINGDFITAGGTILGAGVYTVSGAVGLGANGGGDVSCQLPDGTTATVGMLANGVTFVLGGTTPIADGTCAGQAFCVGAGYGHVTMTAPTSGTYADLLVIGPLSGSTAGASFAQGASNTSLSGTFYFPKGAISLSGAASVGGSGCLQLIGSQVTLAGGSALASPCASASTSKTSVVLVQ